jgi:hypothetical protein
LIVVSLLSFLGAYCSFLIVVSSHRAHAEALRRRPCRSEPSSFLGREKGTLSLGGKEKTILIVVSLLSFLGCVHAEALQRCRRCIALCDCVMAPLAADV